MRYRFLTPHQFQSLSSFMDTCIVSTHSPGSIDVAVPAGASQFIVQRVSERIKERFMGRALEIDLGSILTARGLDTVFLSDCLHVLGEPIRFVVVLTDRVLVNSEASWTDDRGVTWMVVDWWQWFRRRVPPSRLADGWLYLCLCNPIYLASPEFRRTGIQPETAASMAEEGEHLLSSLVSYVCNQIADMWSAETQATVATGNDADNAEV